MAAQWREHMPRKLRVTGEGYKREYLISLPQSIGQLYNEDALFIVTVTMDGAIVLTPVGDNEGGRAA